MIFDELYRQKDLIGQKAGSLEWQRLNNKKACRIKQELTEVNMFDREDWPKMMDFLMESMPKIEEAFTLPLSKVNRLPKEKIYNHTNYNSEQY